jgi:hypothetical protein
MRLDQLLTRILGISERAEASRPDITEQLRTLHRDIMISGIDATISTPPGFGSDNEDAVTKLRRWAGESRGAVRTIHAFDLAQLADRLERERESAACDDVADEATVTVHSIKRPDLMEYLGLDARATVSIEIDINAPEPEPFSYRCLFGTPCYKTTFAPKSEVKP